LVANMVEGGRTPVVSSERLAELGFALAIYPGSGFLAAAAAIENVFKAIRQTGTTRGVASQLYDFTEMNRLMGFEEVWEFDRQHAND
jgi:2,3-dimethylmalate lyase